MNSISKQLTHIYFMALAGLAAFSGPISAGGESPDTLEAKAQAEEKQLIDNASDIKEPGTVEASSDVDKLAALLGAIEALQATFVQKQVAADGYIIRTTRGELQLQRPGKMRWISEPPYEQWVVCNGDRLWIYDPDLEQVAIHSLSSQASGSPILLLTGNTTELTENYQVFHKGEQFFLEPKTENAAYQNVVIEFENGVPALIDVTDTLGEHTIIELTEPLFNPAISSSLFEFQIPEGVDVITND